jgi:hypothetical protein
MKLVELTEKEKVNTQGGGLLLLALALGIYIGYQDAKHEHKKKI